MGDLRLTLLGPPEVRQADQVLLFSIRKELALLIYPWRWGKRTMPVGSRSSRRRWGMRRCARISSPNLPYGASLNGHTHSNERTVSVVTFL